MNYRLILLGTAIVLVGVAGLIRINAQTGRSIWDGVYTEEQADSGAQLYERSCAECHGGELEGGETAPALLGGEFMWAWNGLSVGDLFERLRISMPEGNPSDMSRSEKADVLAFLLFRNDVPSGDEVLGDRTARLRAIAFTALRP